MAYFAAPPATLMQVWRLNRRDCRPLSEILRAARAGILPGVVAAKHSFNVIDQSAALAAMRKARQC